MAIKIVKLTLEKTNRNAIEYLLGCDEKWFANIRKRLKVLKQLYPRPTAKRKISTRRYRNTYLRDTTGRDGFSSFTISTISLEKEIDVDPNEETKSYSF